MNRAQFGRYSLLIRPVPEYFSDEHANRSDSEEVKTISVYNIPNDINRFQLHQHFCEFGLIMHYQIDRLHYRKYRALLGYTQPEEAKRTVFAMNGKKFGNNTVKVRLVKNSDTPLVHLNEEGVLAQNILKQPTDPGIISPVDFKEYPDFEFPPSGMQQ